jgi:4-aminobutyrate aminotransferase/(S)-3-amino-2-methylpropionate transaminase
MALTAKSMPYKHHFGPFAPDVYRMPMSYPFRDGGRTGPDAARAVTTRIDKEIGATNVAAIVIEPIQGEGGFVVPAPGFLPALSRYAADNGITLIADEIQTGFCRTGSWFASEPEGIVPDLVTMAKGIAGGLPLAAVTGRADLMDAVHVGGLGGTYGGNPVTCAAALAALRTMETDDLAARAREIEAQMMPRLQTMARRHPEVGEIRGRGAMLAMELVRPGGTDPDPGLAAAVNRYCHSQGLVTLTAGTFGNVFRFLPPLTISAALVDEGLDILEAAIDAATSRS